jgi:peptidoglycan/xylan/chitin deacetylase (PgdA/CDA1 family)
MNPLRSAASVPAIIVLLVIGLSLGLQSEGPRPTLESSAEPIPATWVETVLVVASPTPTDTETPTPELSLTPTASLTSTPSTTPSPGPTGTAVPSPRSTRIPVSTPGASRTTVPVTPSPVKTPPRTIRAPILMYHYISEPPPDADKIRLDLSVTPQNFQAQVDCLVEAGYHPVRMSDLTNYLLDGASLPSKPIVLTFDDGYSDNFVNAYPVLKARGLPGTFFVVTDWIQSNRWGYMNWTQLSEMAKNGMEIGSHSLNHPDLRGKPRAYQDKQLTDSKQAIESKLGISITAFSFPSGRFDANTLAALRTAGYRAAVTEVSSTLQSSDRILELRRIRVRGSYSAASLAYWIQYFSENGR